MTSSGGAKEVAAKAGGGFYQAGDGDEDDDDDDDDDDEEGQEGEANGASAGAASSDGWDAVRRNGCVLETQTPGDGCTFPRPGDWVSVRYTGTTQQGRKEFSSGGVVDFLMDGRTVIKGLEAGLRQMALGEKGALKICAAYAVGGLSLIHI